MSAEMFLRSARLSSLNSSNSEVANPNEEEKQKTSGELLAEAKEKLKDLRYQSSTLQQRSTNELIQRVKDVDLFKGDLEKEISDFTTSIDALHTTAATLSDAKVLLKRADSVNKESTQVRQNLSTYADRLDRELHKERDLVQSTLSSFTQLSERLESQMKLAETIKGQLERNWSDKSDASDLDSYALGLTQNQAAAGFKPGSIGFVETMSTLDQWHSYTDNHIKDSQQQRMEIKGFSKEIAAFLRETSRELRGQAQVIEAALVDSVRFAVEQQSTMGAMLEAKRAEIGLLRKTIGEIQAELNSKRSPLAVALARVNTRSKRPGIELCDDLAHQALLDEIGALQDVTVKLNADLDHYKDKLKQLQQEQIQLEIQHEKMVDSGKSDSDVLRNVRCLYPTRIQTTGFAAKGLDVIHKEESYKCSSDPPSHSYCYCCRQLYRGQFDPPIFLQSRNQPSRIVSTFTVDLRVKNANRRELVTLMLTFTGFWLIFALCVTPLRGQDKCQTNDDCLKAKSGDPKARHYHCCFNGCQLFTCPPLPTDIGVGNGVMIDDPKWRQKYVKGLSDQLVAEQTKVLALKQVRKQDDPIKNRLWEKLFDRRL